MIKFFRNIRQNLLNKNRFSGYLFYAIGEIVLVVIGILIALQINNNNERRKNEEKVNTLLKQVHKELEGNIIACDGSMRFYTKKDSLIYLVLNNQVGESDYKGKSRGQFTNLVTNYSPTIIQKNAFDNLDALADYIPKSFDSIFLSLKHMYTIETESVRSTQELHSSKISLYLEWLTSNTSWLNSHWNNNYSISQEELDFYLSSDYYRNVVYSYWTYSLFNYYLSIARYRSDAFECYKKLTEKLQIQDELVKNPPPFQYDPETYKDAMGTYKDSTYTYKIFSKNNELFVQQDEYRPVTLIPINQSQFIGVPGRWILNLTYDDQHHVTGLVDRFGNNVLEFKKIE